MARSIGTTTPSPPNEPGLNTAPYADHVGRAARADTSPTTDVAGLFAEMVRHRTQTRWPTPPSPAESRGGSDLTTPLTHARQRLRLSVDL